MKVFEKVDLSKFKFWGEAESFFNLLSPCEVETLGDMLDDLFFLDGIEKTELNDLFWHEKDSIADWLGLDIDEIYEREGNL